MYLLAFAILIVSVLFYFVNRVCRLGQFLSNDEWFVQMVLLGLYLLYIMQFIPSKSFCDDVHSLGLSSCTERTCLLSSAVCQPVVVTATFEASVYDYVVIYVAYHPSYFRPGVHYLLPCVIIHVYD